MLPLSESAVRCVMLALDDSPRRRFAVVSLCTAVCRSVERGMRLPLLFECAPSAVLIVVVCCSSLHLLFAAPAVRCAQICVVARRVAGSHPHPPTSHTRIAPT